MVLSYKTESDFLTFMQICHKKKKTPRIIEFSFHDICPAGWEICHPPFFLPQFILLSDKVTSTSHPFNKETKDDSSAV